jgi:hypothetical protein
VRLVLARIYHGTGRTELALEQLREVVALRPASDEAHVHVRGPHPARAA